MFFILLSSISANLFAHNMPIEVLQEKIIQHLNGAFIRGFEISIKEKTRQTTEESQPSLIKTQNSDTLIKETTFTTTQVQREKIFQDNFLKDFKLDPATFDIDSWAGVLFLGSLRGEDGDQDFLDFEVELSYGKSKYLLYSNLVANEFIEFNNNVKSLCHYRVDFYRNGQEYTRDTAYLENKANGGETVVNIPSIYWDDDCY